MTLRNFGGRILGIPHLPTQCPETATLLLVKILEQSAVTCLALLAAYPGPLPQPGLWLQPLPRRAGLNRHCITFAEQGVSQMQPYRRWKKPKEGRKDVKEKDQKVMSNF